jgi:hypothetical protein
MAQQADPEMIRSFPAGQRLYCAKCGSEIEIVQPCTCDPPDQVLRCCGEAMRPAIGNNAHVGVE